MEAREGMAYAIMDNISKIKMIFLCLLVCALCATTALCVVCTEADKDELKGFNRNKASFIIVKSAKDW